MSSDTREQDYSENVVGVDIGDRVVTAARVQVRKDGQFVLTHAGTQEYAANATDRQIAEAIRALWRSASISCFTVATCLRSQLMCLKHFRFQGITVSELPAALEIEAEAALQMPHFRLAMDWHISRSQVPEKAAPDVPEIDGLLVVASTVDVQRHLSILRLAGLYPVVLDVGALAIANLYHAMNSAKQNESNACLVSLGHRLADIAVLYGSNSVYPRTMVSRAADWSNVPDLLATNIQEVLKYCQFKLYQEPLSKILLCGQIPARSDFVSRLETSLGIHVEIWNPLKTIQCGFRTARLFDRERDRLGSALAVSLGLALRRE